jgi:hypothetical protein
MSTQISPEVSPAAYTEFARVIEAKLLGLDAVFYVRFGDGLERAVPWASLPFARTLALEPITARAGHGGETVVLGDESGREVDVSAQSLRAALDDKFREALRRADSGERKLVGAWAPCGGWRKAWACRSTNSWNSCRVARDRCGATVGPWSDVRQLDYNGY